MALVQTQVLTLPKIKTNSANNANRIPIVQHLIKDEDIIPLEGEQLQPLQLDKIIKLFVDPHSHHHTERHLHSLKKIVKHYNKGYLVKDVVKVIKILNILSDKIEVESVFIPDMCELLQTFSYSFFKEKSSDEPNYETVIVECMANLGYLMRTPSADVRMSICACVHNLLTFTTIPDSYANLQRCSKAYILKTIRNSDLAETLVKALTLMEEDVPMRLKMLQILQIMSKDDKNCEKMISADCASRLILRLNHPKPHEELLFRTSEIIWNLIENGNQRAVAEQFNSLIAINQLREAFTRKALQGYSNYDRQLRNDLLILSNLLVSIVPKLPFIESGMTKQLLLFTTYPEIKSNNPILKNFKLTTCYEDFELKKLLLNFVVIVSKNPTALQLISENSVLLGLLSYVKPVETVRDARDWTLSQFEELQLHAMSTLCIIIPLLLKDYFNCHGSTRLLLFLEWCTNKQNDYNGFGNSFHGKGGRGTKRAQLKYCLRVIRSIVSTGNEQAIQDFTDQDVLSTMTNILTNAANNEEPDDQIDVEIQSDMLFILACICENDLHRKELFGTSGVDILLKYLKKKPELIWNGLGYQRIIIGTIDCIWSSVVGCMMNENYFMEKEGVFFLLDILEASPKSMQNLVLGCLLDLSDNVKSLAHLMQWEGKDNQKVAHLLCNLWREEEKEIGVSRDEQGVIIDTSKPLSSKNEVEANVSLPTHLPSRSIVEVSENMRAKIYGIFCKLGFADLPGLNQKDHITLCIIENYLDFKLGEVFKEVNTELAVDKILPIPPDQEALDTIIRAADERVISVNLTQKHMIETYKEQEDMQEKEFYYDIRKNFSFKERRAQEWKNYVQRCSKYQMLEGQKEKQMTAIEESRLPERDTVVYQTIHNLEIPNLAVTAFCAPFIKIDSTPPELLKNLNNYTVE